MATLPDPPRGFDEISQWAQSLTAILETVVFGKGQRLNMALTRPQEVARKIGIFEQNVVGKWESPELKFQPSHVKIWVLGSQGPEATGYGFADLRDGTQGYFGTTVRSNGNRARQDSTTQIIFIDYAGNADEVIGVLEWRARGFNIDFTSCDTGVRVMWEANAEVVGL